jgi:hypothetical protein
MESPSKCTITFESKHQSESVVVDSEEAIISQSVEIEVVPSFTLI